MKYSLFRASSGATAFNRDKQTSIAGVVVENESNDQLYDFWWPGSVRFKLNGLDWEKLNYPRGWKDAQFIDKVGEFDSLKEIKQWLFETYFEWFL